MIKITWHELKLLSIDGFGPISQTQRPSRVVGIEDGWKAIGVVEKYGQGWAMLQRRRWFWNAVSKPASKPNHVVIGTTFDGVDVLEPAMRSQRFSPGEVRNAIAKARPGIW